MSAATGRQLDVFLDGELVGELQQDRNGTLRFTYDADYRRSGESTPLSLSLPMGRPTHAPRPTRAFFDGLLPDSVAVRQKWATEYGASANNPFSLLEHVGRDAAGAVQVLPPGEAPDDASSRFGDVEWLTDGDVKDMTQDLAQHREDWDPGRQGGRWSLSGAQPKIALYRDPVSGRWGIPRDSTPTTHIIKPMLEGFEGHDLNETLCLRAAAAAGLPAARIELLDIAGTRAIVSTRFDRRLVGGRWVRLHQEDLCQALSVSPLQKYQSDGGPGVGDIAELFAGLPAESRIPSSEAFYRALAFNVLIGGTDAHAKNYSVGLRRNRVQLAPMYDVASAAPYPTHRRLVSAMKVGDTWTMLDVTARDWATVSRRLGISSDLGASWVDQLRKDLPEAFEHAAASLPADVRRLGDRLVEPILDHVSGRWTPSLDRNPGTVVRLAATGRTARSAPTDEPA